MPYIVTAAIMENTHHDIIMSETLRLRDWHFKKIHDNLGLKKKMIVSCNPTLTSFYSENPYPKVFSTFPTPNQRKTCIKHTFLTKKIMQEFFFYRPTYPIFLRTVTGNKQFLFLGLKNQRLKPSL